MANYDILTFLEYYTDKSSVLDGSGKRNPSNAYQNFYQTEQNLTADTDCSQSINFNYLAFSASGFSSIEASSLGNLNIELAATADIIDLTDSAIGSDILIIASLYIQNIGQESLNSNATLICRYIGTIDEASVTDETVSWVVTPAISKQKAQVPSRRVSSDLLGRYVNT